MPASIQLPALRGVMGDWIYYVTLLPFQEVCERIKKTEEVHKSDLLKEWLQRALTNRSDDIAHYLRSHEQRFFNSLVVGVYGGSPEWHEISLRKSSLFDPTRLDPRVNDCLGFLSLSGAEKLFAIDGQHRVEGMKRFVRTLSDEERTNLEDEICAVFVAHRNTAEGMQRTRRLFSTLNRTAKPVSLTEIIALDEDDIVAIVCRSLLEQHPLFRQGRISVARQKSISPEDRHSLTSLVALHQTMNIYLAEGQSKQWTRFRAVRPNEEIVQRYLGKAHSFWDKLTARISALKEVAHLEPEEDLPMKFRNQRDGGDVLFRPIFPPMVARCLRKAIKRGIDEDVFLDRLAKIPRRLSRPPWVGLLWDGNMITRAKNQSLGEALILWMVGALEAGDALREQLARVLSREPEDTVLPDQVF